MIRTLNTKARCMMLDAKLPMKFWAESIRTATYLHQRTPTAACSHKSPYEVLFGEKPWLDHLRRFGCTAYKYIPKEQRDHKKFGKRSRPCMMLGYVHDTTKIWRIWDFERGIHGGAVECSNVIFDEENDGIHSQSHDETDDYDIEFPNKEPSAAALAAQAVAMTARAERRAINAQIVKTANALVAKSETRGGDETSSSLYHDADPISYAEVKASPHRKEWEAAMKDEWQSLLENVTFDFAIDDGLPPEKSLKAIGSKWVFRRKIGPDNSIRYKARLVIKGYEQVPGIDFGETYAPVSKLSTLRLLLAMSAQRGWKIDHMDVKTAFLNPEIDRDNVFMSLPEGIETIDSTLSRSVTVRLRKALYGLKQAPKLWHDNINEFLLSLRFKNSTTDPNLYVKDGVLLLLYVDDILIVHIDKKAGNEVKKHLSSRYKMTDLGEARKFLGLEIGYTANGITLGQEEYINTIVRRFQLQDARDAVSPMDPHVDLDNPNCEDKQIKDQTLYQSMVGSLMYAALGTRPDISFCVAVLSKYSAQPLQMHFTAAKRALRYLKKTSKYVLHFPSTNGPIYGDQIHGFTDSDWAGSTKTRKSVGGYVFQACDEASPISWQAKSQTVVALSTLEAEYIACSNATREALWLKRLVNDVLSAENPSEPLLSTVPIKCDNQGALNLINTGVIKAKTKHIDVKFHHTHDEQEKGNVKFDYIPSRENIADLFTKPLPTTHHSELTRKCGLYEVEE
jgi:hypothetical protein